MQHSPAGVRTYKLRRSRITAGQVAAIETLGTQLLVSPANGLPPEPWASGFDDVVLEIGFGMGEGTLAYAELQPQVAIVAADLHTPGIGNLLKGLAGAGLDNVRVVEADALELLRSTVPEQRLAGVRCFFPDPWPKARHHKRRLVNAANLSLIASRVRPEGFLHFATDWPDYADVVAELLAAHADWELLPSGEGLGWAQPAERPQTKFEQRGRLAGRPITDLVARRR